MTYRVACLSPYSEETVRSLFRGAYEVEVALAPPPPAPEALPDLLREADLVLGDKRHRHRLDRSVLAIMSRCRLIQQPAAGFDTIDHRAAAELGIPVANAAGYNRDSVADWTIMAILTLVRRGAEADRRMRRGEWPPSELCGRELGALTVGIVGLGNTGGAVAARLRAFGCRILFADPIPRSLPGAEPVSLDRLLAEADVVTVHVPLDEGTRGLLNSDRLGRMRPGALLVNASRGPVVDEPALVQALETGHLGGAALDVFEEEPLAPNSPLRRLENVFLTPHIAGLTQEAEDRLLEVCGANLRRVLEGLEPFNVVNGVTRRR
ncbi:MAG TPA: 2-hydroxyacid dehydrogenase [Candidatus Dormibacteraeota bacterium]|nr:2-hydroxyacid dehydrogenase [Candidatus Dormibacteraeota bacterium]